MSSRSKRPRATRCGAPGAPERAGFTAAFINFNRNKRSIVIDVKKEHGRDLVRRLATRADALVENNRPGVADRLGIGYADIRRTNPKIVYCSICGFAPKGKKANAPAYDPVIQGYSGMANVQGGKSGQPTAVKMALADKVSGMTAALGIVSALHAARVRGVGQYIRVPMLEAMMNFAANDSIYGYTFLPEARFQGPGAQEHHARSLSDQRRMAHHRAFHRRAIRADVHWTRASGMVERRGGSHRETARHHARDVRSCSPKRTTAEWLPILEEADIPSGPVHSYDTLFSDEEIVANDSFMIYEHPVAGKIRTVTPGPRFSETPAKLFRVPPKLGSIPKKCCARQASIARKSRNFAPAT